MISRSLERWLWQGSLEIDFRRLDVPDELPAASADLLSLWSDAQGDLLRQIKAMKEAMERQRLLASTGNRGAAAGEGAGSDAEVRQIARSMLPSLDALDRIVEMGESSPRQDEVFRNWLDCVRALRVRLQKTMEGMGLLAISSVGTEVDLEIHDVTGVVPAGEYPANTVVRESLRGYYFRGKLLRDAKVIVAQ